MWIITFFLHFTLGLGTAFSQQELQLVNDGGKSINNKLNQKIKMANFILNNSSLRKRLNTSNDSVAKELVERARDNLNKIETYMDNKLFLEAGAIIDFVLRDLSASSQLLNVPNQKKKKYTKNLEILDSFVLPEWENLSDSDYDFLQENLAKIDELRNDAILSSQSEDYDKAINLLDTAYYLKTTLISNLQHENTVVYDLKFDSAQDEYSYMVSRTHHYLDLVDLTLSKKEVGLQTRKLADNYIYQTLVNLEVAENLQSEGKPSEAIRVLGKSINQLSSVLKMLGIKI